MQILRRENSLYVQIPPGFGDPIFLVMNDDPPSCHSTPLISLSLERRLIRRQSAVLRSWKSAPETAEMRGSRARSLPHLPTAVPPFSLRMPAHHCLPRSRCRPHHQRTSVVEEPNPKEPNSPQTWQRWCVRSGPGASL